MRGKLQKPSDGNTEITTSKQRCLLLNMHRYLQLLDSAPAHMKLSVFTNSSSESSFHGA